MSAARIINNFLNQYRKPYSLEQLSDMTGIHVTTIRPIHATAIEDGKASEIQPGIFVSHLSRSSFLCTGGWNYDITVARRIIAMLEEKPAYSCRELARRLGRSHEYACRYISALLSIDALAVSPQGYIPGPCSDLSGLGTNIIPGIITTRRKAQNIPTRKKK